MSLEPGRAVSAIDTTLDHEPLPADEVVSGTPATAVVELGEVPAGSFGIWEMTEGVATDVEGDEVFVVLSGRARIEFLDRELAPLEVAPGDVVRLESGMHTRWTVTETLRKIWIA